MKNKKGTVFLLALILVAGLGLYLAYSNNDIARPPAATAGATLAELWTPADGQPRTVATQQAAQPATATAGESRDSTSKAAAPKNPNSRYAYRKEYGVYPGEADIPGEGKYLICVNRSRALPARYPVKTEVCVTVYPENRRMEAEAAKKFREMYNAALAEDAELIPFSGYRSTAQQKETFDLEIAALVTGGLTRQEAIERAMRTIQLPGCSEHETGLAMDITRKGVWRTDPGFHGTREFNWLTAHAQDYGFILRYPQGKEQVTGISYEPWHWRYVGVEAARKIRASGQCLEEYLGLG
ncbi:MAG: M15 family metallopeptidase [Oscillospiraceae bacterium]|jgi:LAS superfamily LD-carboxypeptidase LdcB|nr:M15 family metallopeptidase [Oscillospiraceae bacterium]